VSTQQALGVHADIVVEARTCDVPPGISNPMIPGNPQWATDDAERLAEAILARAKP
jgi:hypothetical protein